MQYRHEVKHEISNLDMLILRQRLRAVMAPDSHAIDGQYEDRKSNMKSEACTLTIRTTKPCGKSWTV